MITVQLRYFAALREALGASESLSLDAPCSVAEVRNLLIARGEPHAAALSRERMLRTALNQTLCDESTLVSDGAELAFFPPVTGG